MKRRGRPKHPDVLTPREWEVLALLRQGQSNEEIASSLGISFYTARFHVSEILSKLGLASRQDAARWQADRHDRGLALAPLEVAARRSSLLRTGATVVLGGAAIILLVALGLLIWGVGATRDGGGTTVASPGARTPAALVVINDNGGTLSLIDPVTLRVMGSIDAGYRPWIAVRHSTQQLLVAQAFGPGAEIEAPTLRIFDLPDLSQPVASVEMPDRVSGTVYAPAMTLSGDERYLYYGAVRSVCTGDAAACDATSIGIIDLDSRKDLPPIPLPRGCTYPFVRPLADDYALVMCETPSDITLTRVTPDGAADDVAHFPHRTIGGRPIREVDMGQDGRGGYFVIYRDGALMRSGADAATHLFSGADGAWIDGAQLMPDGPHLLTFSARDDAAFTDAMLLDPLDPSRTQMVSLGGTYSAAAPLSRGRIALIAQGRVRVFDIGSGSLLPDSVEVDGAQEYLASG